MACETWRKLTVTSVLLLILVGGAAAPSAAAAPAAASPAAQDAPAAPDEEAPAGAPGAAPAEDHGPQGQAGDHGDHGVSPDEAGVSHEGVAGGHTGEEQHGESIWGFVGRLFNFAVLAGTLVYLLRAPIGNYLQRRGTEIRSDLEAAEAMRQSAAAQIAEIDARLKQLPSELEALKARGAQEIAAEEARIRAEAEAERERLLDQTRREIDLQLRLARRELVTHAADLAVGVARERIRDRITDRDQLALVDRYLSQVKP